MRRTAIMFPSLLRGSAVRSRLVIDRQQPRVLSSGWSLLSIRTDEQQKNNSPRKTFMSTTTTGPQPTRTEKKNEVKDALHEPLPPPPLVATKSRFRELWDNYGMVFIVTYGSVYVVTLGTVYEFVALEHIDAHGVVSYLHSIGLDKFVDLTPIATSKAGNFALAWILTKFTEPLRLAFTVTITPSLARFVGRAPPKKPREIKFHRVNVPRQSPPGRQTPPGSAAEATTGSS